MTTTAPAAPRESDTVRIPRSGTTHDLSSGAHSLVDDVVATVALVGFSLVVAAGFARVFAGWEFFDNLAVLVVGGHGAALLLRRLNLPLWASFPLLAAALAWAIGAMFYRDTYSLFLPTSDTWTLFRLELDLVGEQFRTAVAPVAFLGGWDVLAAIGIAAVVVLSDTFAFRAFARAEALVPGGVLFVFVAALGDDRSRVTLTAALVGAGVLATAVLRTYHAPATAATIGPAGRHAGWAVPAAVASALVIALAAGVVGPRIPGADAEAIYDTKGGGGGSVTEVVSPLVDIRSRLTNRTTTELFRVEATADAYWRSAALPKFDGRTWGLPERALEKTDGALSTAAVGSIEIRQRVFVSALGGALLPAAAEPIAASPIGASSSIELRYNADAATLVKTGAELERGDTFEIVSAAPRFSAEQLAAATSIDPGDPIYFALPDDFPSSVVATAQEVIGGATSTYDAALTLQNWMQSEFTYSLEIQEGHGNNAIESFLRNRIGYCEQFAGTYAAMMRSVGIPSRVAVGFTPGVDEGSGTYSVLGRNAHAWPEVWFDGLGWVPFEPTPGRGAPGAEDYTGRAPQQDEGTGVDDESEAGDGLGEGDEAAPQTTTPPTTVPSGAVPPTSAPGQANPAPAPLDPTTVPTASTSSGVPWGPLAVLIAVAALLTLPALVRRLRRRVHRSPELEIQRLWTRALDAVAAVGVDVSSDHTPLEAAGATAATFPTAARPMSALADLVTEATYAEAGSDVLGRDGTYGSSLLGNCSVWCRQIEKSVADSFTPIERVKRYFTTWA